MDSSLKILIPVYNEEKTIVKILEKISISCEQIKNYEVIVVDDGSTDFTKEIVAEKFPDVRLLSIPPSGLSAARNIGAEAATARWERVWRDGSSRRGDGGRSQRAFNGRLVL